MNPQAKLFATICYVAQQAFDAQVDVVDLLHRVEEQYGNCREHAEATAKRRAWRRRESSDT